MDSALLEDTIHEMALSLSRLKTDSYEGTPRTAAPMGDFSLQSAFTNPFPAPLTLPSPSSPSSPSPTSYTSRQSLNPQHSYSSYSFTPPVTPISPARDTVIAWPTVDGESTYIRPSQEFLQRRPSTRNSMQHPGRRMSFASSRHTRSSSTTSASSYMPSPFAPPSKPLPAVPASVRSSPRTSSQPSTASEISSVDADRYSQTSETPSSNQSRSSFQSVHIRPPVPPRPPEHLRPGQHQGQQQEQQSESLEHRMEHQMQLQRKPAPLELVYWKQLVGKEKHKSGKTNHIHFTDMSTPSYTVATKHGNSIIKFWSVNTGMIKSTVKISSYIEARARCREYMIRSHLILSEAAALAAIATRFGRTIEIWNYEKPKRLQSIDDADRWVAGRFESYDSGWTALAAYRSKDCCIDLFAATTREKKPFAKVRTIDMRKAGLPFSPQFPELALSPTTPLLVAASGPRTPRAGHPPPDRETLLVTWDISDYRETSHTPHRVIRPWQHKELETALPCGLMAYGDLIVSLWIPAGYRTVVTPSPKGGVDYTLAPTSVPFRYVLVWDLAENSTRTYGIPNTISCVSPDCRFVAYCQVAERRTKLAILDAQSGDELWVVGGEGNLKSLEMMGDLSKVTDLAFSADAKFLMIGDQDGNTSMYDVREAVEIGSAM